MLTSEKFNTPQQQPIMDNRRQSFASSSTDFFYNLFEPYLNTPSSANDHMQYMHRIYFDNEAGSSFTTMQMNTTSLQFESNDEPQPQQPQSPRRNSPCNRRRRHYGTSHHYGDYHILMSLKMLLAENSSH